MGKRPMTKQNMFLGLWRNLGRYEASALNQSVALTFNEKVFLELFLANLVSLFDVRLCKTLSDLALGRGQTDGDLELFLLMMAASLNQGNVYLPAGEEQMRIEYGKFHDQAVLINKSNGTKSEQPEADIDFKENINGFLCRYANNAYAGIVGPLHKPIVKTDEGWFFQKYHFAHDVAKSVLLSRLEKSPVQSTNDDAVAKALARVFACFNLHDNQKLACALACTAKTVVITGGPGTGKTTIVSGALMAMMLAEGDSIASMDMVICAPTGRAAARLEQSIVAEALRCRESFPEIKGLREVKGRTVHGVLGFDPKTGGFAHGKENPIEARVIVIDEVSMLDISIFAALLNAIKEDTTLVLLGDRNQLPSVDAGAVLGDITESYVSFSQEKADAEGIIPSLSQPLHSRLSKIVGHPLDKKFICIAQKQTPMTDKLVVLTKSFRSQKDIIDIANSIKNQIPLEEMNFSGFTFAATEQLFGDNAARVWNADMHASQHGVLRTFSPNPAETVAQWVGLQYGPRYVSAVRDAVALWEMSARAKSLPLFINEQNPDVLQSLSALFFYLDKSAMLCLVHKGIFGSIAANAVADDMLRKLLDKGGGKALFSGCIALVTVNMRQRNLWNGDRGVVLRLRNRDFFVARRHDGFEAIALEEIQGLQQSFALTVHKSQGCEFKNVLCLLVADENHPLLTKEILYTALTRAKKTAVICGSAGVFDAAIGKKVERRSKVV